MWFIFSFYRKVLKEFPSIDPNSAVNQILDMICQTDMLVVTDPGEDRVDSPRGALHTSVKYVGSLYAPEVMDAVASLRIIGEDPIDTHNLVSQPVPKDEPHPASNAEPVIRVNLPPVIIPKPPR